MTIDRSGRTIHLVGHAHIDLAYRWRWNEVVHRVGPATFAGVLRLMEQDEGLTFVQSQMALYEAMRQHYPAIFEQIKQRVSEGRWFPADGWCEYDHTMPCGESMVRQHLIGSDYARKHLGVEIDMAWAADAFSGHTHTLPSILAGCGIKYLLFGRGMPDDTPIFWWEGPDGSRILAYTPVVGYGGPVTERMVEYLDQWQAWGYPEVMTLYGRGDHGGGPREGDLEELARLRALPGAPAIIHGDPERFFADVLAPRDDLPVYSGDLGNPSQASAGEGNFAGSCSSEGRNKQRNRRAENVLLTAERFATMSVYFQRKPCFDRVDFDKAWKLVLRHQFHDELPGTCRGRVFEDNARDYDYVEQSMAAVLDHALGEIGARVDTRGEGAPILVVNPLSWTRTEAVTIDLRLNACPKLLVIEDGEGRPMPTQVLEVREEGHFWIARVLFLAGDIPSLGFKLFRAHLADSPGELSTAEAHVRVTSGRNDYVLESDELQVRIDKGTGQVVSMFDKRLQREALGGPSNALQVIEELAGESSGWKLALTDRMAEMDAPVSIRLIESGPVRATVRIGYRFRDSFFEQEVSVVAGLDRALFRFVGDWHERDCALKVAFAANVADAIATFEQPFGAIVRQADGAEFPAQRWVDVSDSETGLSLLNDCRYAFDIRANVARMTLLRGIPDLDPLADEGHHDLNYAIHAHGPDWQAETVRQGFEVNYPLLARQPMRRAGRIRPWGVPGEQRAVDPEFSFLRLSPKNIVLTALKAEHEDWGQFSPFVIRMYECEGTATEAIIELPHSAYLAVETDHLERPLEKQSVSLHGRRITLSFRPHEIKTLRIALAVPSFGVREEDEESPAELSVPEESDRLEGQ